MRLGAGGVLLPVLLLALLVSGLRVTSLQPFEGLERASFDLRLRLRGPLPPPPRVVIVEIDEAAVSGIGTLGLLRGAVAGALPKIAAAGPAVIAIDLLLASETTADPGLAAAFTASGPVLLAVAATRSAAPPATEAQRAALGRSGFALMTGRPGDAAVLPGLILPQESLLAGPMLAHVNVSESPDGVARALPVALPVGEGVVLPGLPLAAARHLLGLPREALVLRGGEAVNLGPGLVVAPGGQVILNPYGPAGSIPRVALGEVLAGRFDPAIFAGRVVFIGSTAETLRDTFGSAFSSEVAGVEVLATATLNLATGSLIRRDGLAAGLTLGLALVLAAASVGAMRLPGWAGPGLGAVALMGLGFGGTTLAVVGNLWLDSVAVEGSVALALVIAGLRRWRGERALTARLALERGNLARFVAPSLAAALAGSRRPDFVDREQVVTVLFADVIGYTRRAEGMAPAAVATMLSALHARFERAAEAEGAAVIDYLGDGVMMVFGLPDPGPGDSAAAIACARRLIAGEGDPEALALRVSLHSGPVAVVIVGGERQGHLTVTGDTVNVAARLQDVAKAEGVSLVVSESVLLGAGVPPGAWWFLRADALRGRTREVRIFAPVAA